MGERPLAFVGSLTTTQGVVTSAEKIRDALKLDFADRREMRTWEDARRQLIDQADAIGVLVNVNSVVANNTSRSLDPDEFRGFALSDDIAPLVFVNAADSKAAQMFTIAHELAHIWLGKTALDDAQAATVPDQGIEKWCNQVAAEILAPVELVRREFKTSAPLRAEVERLAKQLKVSTLVIIRRAHDAGKLTKTEMWAAYRDELKRIAALDRKAPGGGDFYATQRFRVGARFLRAVVASTLEGQTLHRDAYRMLGISSAKTLDKIAENMGVA